MRTPLNITNRIKLSAILGVLIAFQVPAAEKLRFIGDLDFPTGEKFQETEIGGLSGIAFDSEKNKILAVSDDKGFVNETRFYTFDIQLDEKNFSLKPSAVTKFKNKEGQIYTKGVADFEGIALLKKDEILVSSEGSVFGKIFQPPELLHFKRNGDYVQSLKIPAKFIGTGITDIMVGTRGNKAFETLSISPDGQHVMMATEESLFQDGSISTATMSSAVRIIHYKNLTPVAEYAYRLEKVEIDKAAEIEIAENGLVDMAMIDDKSFYSLERSYLPLRKKNIIRIYKNTISPETTNVSGFESLKTAHYNPVKKTLIMDLDEILPLLKSQTKALDNIEGLTFGPVLKNGNKTLIVCSDNNFGKNQRTMFVAFEIVD